MLELTDVTSGYGSLEVLHEVSLTVEAGEIVGILGPNGAGKSTIFRTIFGFQPAWTGTIHLRGEDITDAGPSAMASKGLCYVMQGQRIFPQMTVRENLEIASYALDDGAFDERLARVHEVFPVLEEKAHLPATNLSGGEKKMVEIGMGLVVDPDVVLLDEPSLGLAPKVRETVFERVQELNREGLSFLIIEQNIRNMLAVADRAYVLEQGRVRMSDTGENLLEDERVIDLYLGERG